MKSFWPILPKIPLVGGFSFHQYLPWNHFISNNFTFQLQLFNCIVSKIFGITNILTLLFGSCGNDSFIFRVKNLLEFIVSDLRFIFRFHTNIFLSNVKLGDLKRQKYLLNHYWTFCWNLIIFANKVLKNSNAFFLNHIKSLFLDGDSWIKDKNT